MPDDPHPPRMPRQLQPERSDEAAASRPAARMLRPEREGEAPEVAPKAMAAATGPAAPPPAGRTGSNRRTMLVALAGAGVAGALLLKRAGSAESMDRAVASGRVRVQVRSWSPGFFKVDVEQTSPGDSELELSIPLGTVFESLEENFQNIVVTGVRDLKDQTHLRVTHNPATTIRVGKSRVEVMLDGYCANFHRMPPGNRTPFRFAVAEPGLVCILEQAAKQGVPIEVTQTAVWIRTDGVTYERGGSRIATRNQFDQAAVLAAGCAR